ncbi:hypothetical protein [Alkalicoccobacillus porphyridii]|uniref:Uncharacterized protein n=1 Tax=Alkalicoccobacillus porphyridii TaxID=2597270 RepID=A0A553ZU30_9BACI|nr:hypothetical protein [Alkalicoccobacillus porphyridii]TSB44981.1 hypothetical protein FN960_18580 [Alkalicoccobacillus porphyridii]
MIELLLEMMMLWAVVLIGIYMLAAFSTLNLSFNQHKVKWNQQKTMRVEAHSHLIALPIRPMSVIYRPKIPSVLDQIASDDEAPSLVAVA